ncbi:D-2-hydroxyacid dehydrogenase [Bradyrhizobium huanghuaihaiense]|uniref:D-2-hydroxyacid dehydrogenase n=1 Tax=Bradyrhizobium huanghuaihaiense TaxID=990078 RepID=UPI0021AA3845|nr:D-2-hydroxyacid dehydrogenase [Bradyrhizobium sp. CB3035]UWU75867.1 D-2-hydroxyacid dehydrogenase [Bradyrhizobium sp. CB3035]
MAFSTPSAADAITVLIHDASADDYLRLIRGRFPNVRVLCAKDAKSLERHVPEADVILTSPSGFPARLFENTRRLRWVQATVAGVEAFVPIRERISDIIVTNARGIHGDLIADFVMTGIGMMQWDFPTLMSEQSRKEWRPRCVPPLAERTLGVVGLGSVGSAIARRGKSAGMTVIGSKRDVSQPIADVDRLVPPDALPELLALSDFVVLAVPRLPETSRLIGGDQLQVMRRSAFLINIARGSVVVETELVEALQAGTISGALLDVFEREPLPADSPLWTMPNVIIAPHIAGYPSDYSARVFEIFGDNLQRFIEKRPLRNVVDLTRGY